MAQRRHDLQDTMPQTSTEVSKLLLDFDPCIYAADHAVPCPFVRLQQGLGPLMIDYWKDTFLTPPLTAQPEPK